MIERGIDKILGLFESPSGIDVLASVLSFFIVPFAALSASSMMDSRVDSEITAVFQAATLGLTAALFCRLWVIKRRKRRKN